MKIDRFFIPKNIHQIDIAPCLDEGMKIRNPGKLILLYRMYLTHQGGAQRWGGCTISQLESLVVALIVCTLDPKCGVVVQG
jgi:hypothetical protein